MVGDLNDPSSQVAGIIDREPVAVRRPEKGTRPGLFYKGATQATLDPLAARKPDGGLYAWATQPGSGPGTVGAGHPGRPNSRAEALLSYDVPVGLAGQPVHVDQGHRVRRAAGPAALILAGQMSWGDSAGKWAAPLTALALLGLTSLLLIWDLKHPFRFYLIFTRRRWRSWLVRGSFVIGGYGGAAALYLIGSLAGAVAVRQVAAGFAIPLALGTACYTAYLFAQARARDLWQSPLLAPHLAVQAVLAGAAALLPFADWLSPHAAVTGTEVLLAASAAAHVLLVAGEITVTHPTQHARMAAHAMTGGRYARFFWPGLAAVTAAAALAAVAAGTGVPAAGIATIPLALAGLLAHEHAYVQAGQSVPLA